MSESPRQVLIIEAASNEPSVTVTLWVTVDAHGTVHRVAYKVGDGEPSNSTCLWCPTYMNDCGMLYVNENGDDDEEVEKRKAAWFICSTACVPYPSRLSFMVSFTRSPFTVAFPHGVCAWKPAAA